MIAYEGSENYIFVSYAHKDSSRVIPVIEALDKLGFRIWYDSGIEVGSEWPEYIENHLLGSSLVLVFMTPSCVNSPNCRNEINLACQHRKGMLVVYLQPTELIRGMNLQLGAVQAIDAQKHPTLQSLSEALARAQLLQPCKIGWKGDNNYSSSSYHSQGPAYTEHQTQSSDDVMRSGDRFLIKESRKFNPPMIGKVGTMGAKKIDNPWPKGSYSSTIDVMSNMAVYFHINLVRTIEKDQTLETGLLIFDEIDNLVYENISNISFKVGYDRISKSWIVHETSGVPQSPGVYTALLWVGDSRIFEYKFKLFSSSQTSRQYQDEPKVDSFAITNAARERDKLLAKMQYPKMAVIGAASFICLFSFFNLQFLNISNSPVVSVLSVLAALSAMVLDIILFRLTRKYLFKSKILALIACTIGTVFYYPALLAILAVITLINRKEWKQRINELTTFIAAN